MSSPDDRPKPRKRIPRPAPDVDIDPMDTPSSDQPGATVPAARKSEASSSASPAETESAGLAEEAPVANVVVPRPVKKPARKSSSKQPATVPVSPKDPEERAVVQLGIRVSVKVDQHLEQVRAATGRTRRELVESAIMALRVPSSS